MRFGVVILPEHPWSRAEPIWRRAEELGFDDAWTYDHIAWGRRRDQPWFGAVPTLAAAAAVTERIRLGTLVASPNFRHPVPFARDLIALDDISGGRFTLGIGAGGTGWDATVLGQQPWSAAERADRFPEFVELTDRLLRATTGRVRYDGRFYSAHEAPMRPGCVQTPRVPLAVAALGPRSMRLAATFGEAWVTTGDRFYDQPPLDAEQSAALLRQQVDRLEQACAAVGRDPA